MATLTATKPIRNIQEPPLIGSMSNYNQDRLDLLLRVTRECGDIGSFHFGPFSVIMLNASEFVHSVLVEHAYDFDKGTTVHNAFRPVIGDGIFTSEGDFHRRQRKLIAPAFQPRQIVKYANTMVDYGEQLQAEWKDGMTVDVSQEMTHVTMSIVGKVLFDADVFTEADDLGAAMTTVLEHVNYMLSHLFPIPLIWPIPRNQRTKKAIAVIKNTVQKMIDKRRASDERKDDLLSILLRAREEDSTSMSDDQVRSEALTLFGAGHETTAVALSWLWYMLATHPAIYRKVQQEIDSVLQGRSPTYADLANLPYTLQTLKETLRLYPPAYVMSRVALRDVEINGYQVRKGQTVLMSPYTIHRRPDYFPNPEQFDPERFTPENEKSLPRYAYMPFGAGPRICIGTYFAMMEGHLLLATLAQRVSFELLPGQQIIPAPKVTIRPKYGIKMVVRHRNLAH